MKKSISLFSIGIACLSVSFAFSGAGLIAYAISASTIGIGAVSAGYLSLINSINKQKIN